jgi:hypothetical protein
VPRMRADADGSPRDVAVGLLDTDAAAQGCEPPLIGSGHALEILGNHPVQTGGRQTLVVHQMAIGRGEHRSAFRRRRSMDNASYRSYCLLAYWSPRHGPHTTLRGQTLPTDGGLSRLRA